tara:strand:+ start:3779 stop:4027 length:249 start_codon:yes stop_codon:yes gene_type:complete
MTLKQQVDRAGHKLSSKCTLWARNKSSDEIYSVIGVSNGCATLRSEYNAKPMGTIKLEKLYSNYLGVYDVSDDASYNDCISI